MNNIDKKLELLLFIKNSPVKKNELLEYLKCSKEELDVAIFNLINNTKESSIIFLDDGTSLTLSTNPKYESFIADVLAQDKTKILTKNSQETLSAISYIGPVSKSDLDFLRGVNTQFTLKSLLIRGLIKETSDNKLKKYSITLEFLRHMNISSQNELENYQEIRENLITGIKNIKEKNKRRGAAI